MKPHRKQARERLTFSNRATFDEIIMAARLTPVQEEVIVLKYNKGMLNYQIAQQLNIAPDTVRDILAKAYDKVFFAL